VTFWAFFLWTQPAQQLKKLLGIREGGASRRGVGTGILRLTLGNRRRFRTSQCSTSNAP